MKIDESFKYRLRLREEDRDGNLYLPLTLSTPISVEYVHVNWFYHNKEQTLHIGVCGILIVYNL